MRNDPFADQARARELLNLLAPHELKAAVKSWTRGGLPSQSIPEGSRSAETPIPGFDKMDRQLRQAEKECFAALHAAAAHLNKALFWQNWVLRVEENLPEPEVFPCSNLACTDELEPGRKSGECSKCRQHRSRYGEQWPRKQESA